MFGFFGNDNDDDERHLTRRGDRGGGGGDDRAATHNSFTTALLSNTNLLVECFHRLDDTISELRKDMEHKTAGQTTPRSGRDPEAEGQPGVSRRSSLTRRQSMHQAYRQRRQQQAKLQMLADLVDDTDEGERQQTVIEIRVVFLKLGEIDTVRERFTCTAYVQAKWREPLLDNAEKTNKRTDIHEDDLPWNPQLIIDNCLDDDPRENIWYIVAYSSAGEATVFEGRRIKGNFYERMELMQYPFDTQDLTISVSSELNVGQVELTQNSDSRSSVNVEKFGDEQEWELHNCISVKNMTVTDPWHSSSKYAHPVFAVSCQASRKPSFFIWNIILVMIFICSLVFTTFAIEEKLSPNRLQLSFILLLSNITFKFVVTQTLPKISYLTFLDRYILISMAILCLVCAWHAALAVILDKYGEDTAKQADDYAVIVAACIYVSFNLGFFIYIFCIVKKRARELLRTVEMKKAKVDSTTNAYRYA